MNPHVLDFLHFNNPTKDQVNALNGIHSFLGEDNNDDFAILRGAAGTGKTSIVSAIVGYLNNADKKYKIAAPTGRAARIIGYKTDSVASTIHSMIYIPEPDRVTRRLKFKAKVNNDIKPTVYIIDESSMIPSKSIKSQPVSCDSNLLKDLVKYVKVSNEKNKIIFLGDHYQLPPMHEEESNALSIDYLREKLGLTGSFFILNEVKRQEDGSYILESATSTRKAIENGAKSHELPGAQLKNIHYAVHNYSHEINQNGPSEAIAIAVSHKANAYFNDLVRSRQFGRNRNLLEPGDILMITRNWTRNDHRLFNGDRVKLIEVDWNSVETVHNFNFVAVKIQPLFSDEIITDLIMIEAVTSDDGNIDFRAEGKLLNHRYAKNKVFRESQKPEDDKYVGALRVMYGHSITCQKAQGGEWNKVYLNSYWIPSLRWQYTAVTRGKEQVIGF